MHNELDEVIYVGKAVKLKNRVRQYFQSDRNKTEKIRKMVSHIAWFETILTDSETEALVLECNLIKEYRPRYNTMLMDDKGYPFICVSVSEEYPRVYLSRSMKKDKNRYFGPYTSSMAVKDTLELLHKLFKIRTCTRVLPRDFGKQRPCLNYDMGQCLAPCQGNITPEAYKEGVDSVIRFLSGDFDPILTDLTERMNKASEALDFEEAIRLRDLLNSVNHVAEKQKITDTGSFEDRDIIACAVRKDKAVVQVFFVREGKLMGRDHFRMNVGEEEEEEPQETKDAKETEEAAQIPEEDPEDVQRKEAMILENFVKQFYAGTPFIPKELLLQTEIEDRETIENWLSEKRGHKVTILVPKRGEKEKLIELAKKNAEMILQQDEERVIREEKRTTGAVHEIEEITGLTDLHRMEAFDISNISGFESVASMVVFEDGRAKKNDYRKFRIRTVSGPDDYASMEEVLTRRFRHVSKGGPEGDSFLSYPDLILMDGGKGQVHIAEGVLESLGLSIPVCGMVKDDHHNTRGLYFHDEELPIDRHSEGFHLITRIQDEAHRFAITYHRGLHTQNSVRSVLDEIPGVGDKRKKALMRHFDSIEALREADIDEIAALPEFNRKAAEEVAAYFKNTEKAEEKREAPPL